MKDVIIIGSGIAGLSCAVRCAMEGIHVTLVSPYPSERSQSVMAAGGINAVASDHEEGDTFSCHIEDTLKGGGGIGGQKAVTGLCENAEGIIRYLERIGTVFSVDASGSPKRRAFGGQSYKRTFYCGAATGKQIVSGLTMEARRFEAAGLITRRLRCHFHSALINGGICYGAMLFNEDAMKLELLAGDALVMATGGQNAIFGKTTGSTQCDGYAAGRLFLQGVELKNLEFIQYHPTTLETPQKRMLVSEAARGDGGRLFYKEDGKRVYFMEDKYGPRGNLMTRDVISREIYNTKKDVYLDVSFLGRKTIDEKLPEVRELCKKYRGIDIAKEPIPVAPSVHFFMGGIAVHLDHETNIRNLFAIGECASMYHGANRLGGNSLLAAVYSGIVAAKEIGGREEAEKQAGKKTEAQTGTQSEVQAEIQAEVEAEVQAEVQAETQVDLNAVFREELAREEETMKQLLHRKSSFPVMYIRDMLAETMNNQLGIVRDEESLAQGLKDIEYYMSVADKLRFDSSVPAYYNYSLTGMLAVAKATMLCAAARKESRGAHYRGDFPERDEAYAYATLISYDEGRYNIRLDKEHVYES